MTTPVVFFGKPRFKISSLFKSLTKIFKFSILVNLLVSGLDFFSALVAAEDSSLPNKTFLSINF